MKNRPIQRRWRSFLVDQDGAVGIVIALLLPILFGFAGLAVDKGHEHAVRSQLKNAADAGALSGARRLFPYDPTTKQPEWIAAATKAKDTVEKNLADTHSLTVSVASPGSAVPPLDGGALLSQATPCYWNLNDKTTKPSNATPLAYDVPAMQVKVSKTAGQNDGPVQRYLAPVLNIIPGVFVEPTVDVTGTSVAVAAPKGIVGLKPLALPVSVWDTHKNTPGQENPNLFNVGDPISGPHPAIIIDDTMWTTFLDHWNSNAETKRLINEGSTTPLAIGDIIHLQPGERAADYGPQEMGQYLGQTVVLPIVQSVVTSGDSEQPIVGFAPFHITGYAQGGNKGGLAVENGKYLMGYFDDSYVITTPGGTTVPPGPGSPPFFQLVY